ncbi:ribonuclease H-like protein [Xylariaceae sp. FL0016]|nr:ribonuclease H-like protein [Xylariaceae sp. FL0016]
MATKLPKHALWHPSRGISFAPGLHALDGLAPGGRVMNDVVTSTQQAQSLSTQSSNRLEDAFKSNEVSSSGVTAEAAGSESTAQNVKKAHDVKATPETSSEDTSAVTTIEDEAAKENKPTDHPPVSALDFKIVDDLFYAAKKAPPGSPESFWSYAQYRGPGKHGKEQKVPVHYCRSKHTMERVCQNYFMDEEVLGFDLEWVADSTKRDGVRKNISLIQLASPSRIALFHVAVFANSDELVAPSFRTIMEDAGVTKVGVAIKGDATRLRNFLDIHSRGLIELSHLYKLVTYSPTGEFRNINRRLVSMATQVEQYLHLPLYKGQDIRSGDWTQPLNMDQVVYSASDAYAGLHLYATLEHHRKQLDPCPPTPHFAEKNLPIRLAQGVELSTKDEPTEPIDDVPPTTSSKPSTSVMHLASALESIKIEEDLPPLPKTPSKPPSKTPSKSITTPKRAASPSPPKDSRVEAAEDRASTYRASHPRARASFSQLRAYYLWHHYDLTPAVVAQLLRSPPLKTMTVAGYILTVVQWERLPTDRDRLREEVVGLIPESAMKTRWPGVSRMIEVVG